MPIYVYEIVGEGSTFEISQKIDDPVLTEDPSTGRPVRRVIQAPHIGGRYTEVGINRRMKDDKYLAKHGFTTYERRGKGVYQKRSGDGPEIISGE